MVLKENTEQRLARVNAEVASSIADFNKLLTESVDIAKDLFVEFQAKIVLELFTRIVLKTPVDTGRARGNWQLSLRSPAEAVLSDTQASANQIIEAGIAKLNTLGFGDTVWISNNLQYITFLEDGSSTQAPTGMVKVSLAEIATIFN